MQKPKLKPGANSDLLSLNMGFNHLLHEGGEELQRAFNSVPVACSASCLLPSGNRLPGLSLVI